MDDLRAALVDKLTAAPLRGPQVWSRPAPWSEALEVAAGREREALEVAEEILAGADDAPHLRANTVPLLAQLLMRTSPTPTAEAMFDAAAAGEPIVPLAPIANAMEALLDDRDVEVQVAAAIELVAVTGDDRIDDVRDRVGALYNELSVRRRNVPAAQHALARLGGAKATLPWLLDIACGVSESGDWLDQTQATTGALPPDIAILVRELAADPPPGVAEQLPAIFSRIDAIAARRDPQPAELAGTKTYDPDTVLAANVMKLYIATRDPGGAAGALGMLRSASPVMTRALIELGVPTNEAGARVLSAVVGAGDLDPEAVDMATAALAILARRGAAGAQTAREALARLDLDEAALDAKVERFVAKLR